MKLSYVISKSNNPYENIALEEYLLKNTQPDECILYLWQNRKTVVIGKNQNPWKECKVEELEKDEGFLARRLSGGGAVFHDLGNLNFTFLVREKHYNVDKQLSVILKAVQKFGLNAVKSGRNDITVDEKKFSGNAFYQTEDFCYHHGTLLLNVDMSMLSHYLNVSAKKLQSKGVDSVKSRVCNLSDLSADITVESMKTALISAFEEVYEGTASEFTAVDNNKFTQAVDKFSKWEWLYGRKIPFNTVWTTRFDWGEVQMQFAVNEGVITDVKVWTDALDDAFSDKIESKLRGVKFNTDDMKTALADYSYIMEAEWDV